MKPTEVGGATRITESEIATNTHLEPIFDLSISKPDNDLHPHITIAEVYKLATAAKLSVQVLSVQVAKLETQSTIMMSIGAFVIVAVAGAIGNIYLRLNDIDKSVTAIKQQLADGGNKQIVATLNAPASPQQLNAGLTTVVAQVQTARADGTPPNPEKVSALSKAMASVIQKNPDLPDAWGASSQLISYRTFHANQTQPPPCGGPLMNIGPNVEFVLSQCTLILDGTQLPADIATEMSNSIFKLPHFILELDRVTVIYHGGPLPPKITDIIFKDCNFQFDLSTRPPTAGFKIAEGLLETPIPGTANVAITGD